jgi:hypothetical protein
MDYGKSSEDLGSVFMLNGPRVPSVRFGLALDGESPAI